MNAKISLVVAMVAGCASGPTQTSPARPQSAPPASQAAKPADRSVTECPAYGYVYAFVRAEDRDGLLAVIMRNDITFGFGTLNREPDAAPPCSPDPIWNIDGQEVRVIYSSVDPAMPDEQVLEVVADQQLTRISRDWGFARQPLKMISIKSPRGMVFVGYTHDVPSSLRPGIERIVAFSVRQGPHAVTLLSPMPSDSVAGHRKLFEWLSTIVFTKTVHKT